ncbi:MAG: hypothetical protein HFE52_04250 [Clostridia bacterium]|nr:hypothetical protein [Clostridia bacterium]MCI8979861.1 hypothetical protein [Clostridia bacterium]
MRNRQYNNLYIDLKNSINIGEQYFNDSLILNPVENIPSKNILYPYVSYLHGLYNADIIRNNTEKLHTKIQFAGRDIITHDVNKVCNAWASLLGGEAVSMRLLSGLHAHIVLFMSISSIGDRVLLLPEKAGGHMATKAILERLGLTIKELEIDYENMRINKSKTEYLIREFKPQFIFIDRSEGLLYEDFSWLGKYKTIFKIFDASQYITNIISEDYINPFDMGFDLIVSTLHKNIPGPQHAFLCIKHAGTQWDRIMNKINTYVSNMHVASIYSAGLLLYDIEELKSLSTNMLKNTLLLEHELSNLNIPIVTRNCTYEPNTHHIWIKTDNSEEAFKLFTNLERIGIMTNYRLLPYNLGYGLRLGLSAATYSGLLDTHIHKLALIIRECYINGYTDDLCNSTKQFIKTIKNNN